MTNAAGCTDITLPQAPGTAVRVTLVGLSGDAACSADACQDGLCAGLGDAGALDAGALDAGALDAGALDAGALDAGALDTGSLVCDPGLTSCGGTCTDVMTDTENCGRCASTCRGSRGCCVEGSCAACP